MVVTNNIRGPPSLEDLLASDSALGPQVDKETRGVYDSAHELLRLQAAGELPWEGTLHSSVVSAPGQPVRYRAYWECRYELNVEFVEDDGATRLTAEFVSPDGVASLVSWWLGRAFGDNVNAVGVDEVIGALGDVSTIEEVLVMLRSEQDGWDAGPPFVRFVWPGFDVGRTATQLNGNNLMLTIYSLEYEIELDDEHKIQRISIVADAS